MFTIKKIHWLGLLLVLTLAACTVPSAAPGSAPAAPTSTVRVIKHAFGETEITGTPQRVVALEWTYVENVLALGVQPVGVADIEGYNDWVKTPIALSPDVVDVGVRGEPNLETLVGLKPDLLIVSADVAPATYETLREIAPTLVFDPYPVDDSINHYDEMVSTFRTLADVLGRVDEGEAVLAHLDQKFVDARTVLEANGKVGEKFVLSQAWSGESAVDIRLFTAKAMSTQIIMRIGLAVGLDERWYDDWQQYGFAQVSPEKLPELGDLNYFYVVQDSDDVFAAEAIQPLWQQLDFVKNGHAYPLGGDTWLFGGPLSAELLVDIVVEALVPGAVIGETIPVTIQHEGGETTFASTPQRVVALEYSYIDALQSLNLQPIGYADDGVPAYLVKGLTDAGATPVGTRNEPSLETISQLQPDLIIADLTRHSAIYEQLSQIAPTLMFDSYRGSYENQIEIFEQLTQVLHQEAAGQQVIADALAALDEARTLAEGHGRAVVIGVLHSGGFTAHSAASFKGSLLAELGLPTALGPKDQEIQFLLDLEGIVTLVPEAFVITCAPEDNQILTDWVNQPVWQQLDAVKNQQVYVFNRDLWSKSRGLLALHLVLRDAAASGLLTDEPSRSTICPDPVLE